MRRRTRIVEDDIPQSSWTARKLADTYHKAGRIIINTMCGTQKPKTFFNENFNGKHLNQKQTADKLNNYFLLTDEPSWINIIDATRQQSLHLYVQQARYYKRLLDRHQAGNTLVRDSQWQVGRMCALNINLTFCNVIKNWYDIYVKL